MSAPVLLYDDACPMCQAYTSGFARLGWAGRSAFSQVDPGAYPALDLDRGRHEIPLVDAQTGEVRYGLDAMTHVLAQALPPLAPLLRHRAFVAAWRPLYWLITYNRRVIAGTPAPATGFDCAPDVHLGWRLTYVALAVAGVAAVGLPSAGWWGAAAALTVVGMVWSADRLTFLGHAATVALMVALLTAALPVGVGAFAAAGVVGWELHRRTLAARRYA